MKLRNIREAVGQTLCYDVTQIIKGVTEGALFRKGHVIKEEDVAVLLTARLDAAHEQ